MNLESPNQSEASAEQKPATPEIDPAVRTEQLEKKFGNASPKPTVSPEDIAKIEELQAKLAAAPTKNNESTPAAPAERQEVKQDIPTTPEKSTSPEKAPTSDQDLQKFADERTRYGYDAKRWNGVDKKVNIADGLRSESEEAKKDRAISVIMGLAGSGLLTFAASSSILTSLTAGTLTAGAALSSGILIPVAMGVAGVGVPIYKGYKIFKSWKNNRDFKKLTGESYQRVLQENKLVKEKALQK